VNRDQLVFAGAAMVIIMVIALAAQFHWLPGGKAKTVLVFIAGSSAILALWLAGIPRSWFSGSKTGFGMTLFFLASAIVGKTKEETSFRMPLMLGMGLTMLVANVVGLVREHW
jgi:hypothetical protein